MNEQVEEWFVTCLFVLGPKAGRVDIQEFFEAYIPNGSGSHWYAAYYDVWLFSKRKKALS